MLRNKRSHRVVSPASSSTKEVLPLRKGSANYLQFACDHLDQVRRGEKPSGIHFLRSSFTNNRADAFSPGSASQLVETPQGPQDCHINLPPPRLLACCSFAGFYKEPQL
ncbi:unnamed protein product [Rangifer tarandus platyrhynchus]|uniref:Uncharacterized protein n=1 Tax=Rangifer tarandus platyrhynchus TaxID=3082113 RepID=A0AC60A1C3_RANTA